MFHGHSQLTISDRAYAPAYSTARPGVARTTDWRVVAGAAVLFALFLIYLTRVLQFGMLQSDVLNYWKESLRWAAPYSTWWVPGYPLTIALVRAVTFDSLPPLAVMLLITGTFYLVAVKGVYTLAQCVGIPQPSRVAALFAAYPFVGLSYSVYPVADVMATALLVLWLIAYERRQWLRFAVYAACVMMVHKAAWFSVPPLWLFVAIRHKEARAVLPLAVVPLLVWIAAGALHHGDALWFVRWGVDKLVVSRTGLPFADGLIGPFLHGSPAKLLKGLVVLTVASCAVVAGIFAIRQRFWSGVAICLPIVLMSLVINEYEIWAVVRFSRLLVIPVAYMLAHGSWAADRLRGRAVYAVLLAAAVASNFLYGYYLSTMYFT